MFLWHLCQWNEATIRRTRKIPRSETTWKGQNGPFWSRWDSICSFGCVTVTLARLHRWTCWQCIFRRHIFLIYSNAERVCWPNEIYDPVIYSISIFSIHCSYPFKPPVFKFLTKIIHPNISRHGDIGLDIITWNYNLALTLNKMLLSIQSLLCDPYTMVTNEMLKIIFWGHLYNQWTFNRFYRYAWNQS